MNKTIALVGAIFLVSPALAQDHGGHASHAPAVVQIAQATSLPKVQAVVRTVDKSAKKITLKHGDIPNLDMGAMTMVFAVQDAALLDKAQAGDQVLFTVDKIKGAYTVLSIERVTP